MLMLAPMAIKIEFGNTTQSARVCKGYIISSASLLSALAPTKLETTRCVERLC